MDYRDAGVDISAADEAKDRIKTLARGTFNAGVLSEIGSFGGHVPARPRAATAEPVLVASTDGVGTKIQVAIAAGVHDTVGYDLVAHCVNDILVQGAVPLFFLDYIALGQDGPGAGGGHRRRLRARLRRVRLPADRRRDGRDARHLRARTTTTWPGFIVGVVDRRPGAARRACATGDVLLGLPSAGLHTNGYIAGAQGALRRRSGHARRHPPARARHDASGGRSWPPTAATWPPSSRSSSAARSAPSCHITGGGFPGNIPRVLPDGPRGRGSGAAPGRCRRCSG